MRVIYLTTLGNLVIGISCASSFIKGATSTQYAIDPMITSPPTTAQMSANEILESVVAQKGDDVDLVSMLLILRTGVPQSLLEIALTNIPQVSSALWSDFLDDKTPGWFQVLPTNIQNYLKNEFVPSSLRSQTTDQDLKTTATPTPTPLFTTILQTSFVTATASSQMSNSSQTVAPVPIASANNDLTMAQKIGIGIGVPVGVAAIAAFFLCCFLLRRRPQKSDGFDASEKSEKGRPLTPAFLASTRRTSASEENIVNAPLMSGAALASRESRELEDIDAAYFAYEERFSGEGRYPPMNRAYGNGTGSHYENSENPYTLPTASLEELTNMSHAQSQFTGDGDSRALPGAQVGGMTGGVVLQPRRSRGSRNRRISKPAYGSLGSVPEHQVPGNHDLISGGAVAMRSNSLESRKSWEKSHVNKSFIPARVNTGVNGVRRKSTPSQYRRNSLDHDGPVSPSSPLNPAYHASTLEQASVHPAFRNDLSPPPRTLMNNSPFAEGYAESFAPNKQTSSLSRSPIRTSTTSVTSGEKQPRSDAAPVQNHGRGRAHSFGRPQHQQTSHEPSKQS